MAQVGWGNSGRGRGAGWLPRSLPSRSNFTSLAALMPSSLRFFSIALLRSRAALSSALRVHPMVAPSLPQPARLGWHDSPGRRAPHPPKSRAWAQRGENHDILSLAGNKIVERPEPPQKRQPLSRFQRRKTSGSWSGSGGVEVRVAGVWGSGVEGGGARGPGRRGLQALRLVHDPK